MNAPRMSLDDDTRHSERNEQALQRATDQLRPAIRQLLAEMLCDGDMDELPAARDAIKDLVRIRRLRQERTDKAVSEMILGTLKWIGGIAAGGLIGWFSAHQGGGK